MKKHTVEMNADVCVKIINNIVIECGELIGGWVVSTIKEKDEPLFAECLKKLNVNNYGTNFLNPNELQVVHDEIKEY